MKNYRGYYIGNIIFHSEKEIDSFLKNQAIDSYRRAMARFYEEPSMELSVYCSKIADQLATDHGMSWGEIEAIELDALAA